MSNKRDATIAEGGGAVRSSDLFGSFRAELWEADEYVITCKAGVIGHTIDKRTAQWLPAWLNSAMAEAMTKLPNKDSATCVNCKYWLKQSMASGECRRHAPQVVAYTESQTKGEHGEYRESVDSHTQSEWPVTPAGEWCGEYEPQNESASRSEL